MANQTSHSEQDARTKWCPFARFHPDIPGTDVQWKAAEGAGNRFNQMTAGPLAEQSCRCIASDCMAWRWVETHVPGPMREDGGADFVPSGDAYGYCGIAGDPMVR